MTFSKTSHCLHKTNEFSKTNVYINSFSKTSHCLHKTNDIQ